MAMRDHVETGLTNEYGDLVASNVLTNDRGETYYRCREDHWKAALVEWQRERRTGNENAPQPMPSGHMMFVKPYSYSCTPPHPTPHQIKRARWNTLKGRLSNGARLWADLHDRNYPERRKAVAQYVCQYMADPTGEIPELAALCILALV
jgi:hypothetical protein